MDLRDILRALSERVFIYFILYVNITHTLLYLFFILFLFMSIK